MKPTTGGRITRAPVVGVMGGATATAEVAAVARELGGRIAQRGWILLNGGRNTGVMAETAAGAKACGGTVIGILPDATPEQASPDLDVVILTGMGDARNVINVLSSDVVIACAGALGTLSEIALALKNGKRVIVLDGETPTLFGADLPPTLAPFHETGQLTTTQVPGEAIDQASAVLTDLGFVR